MRDLIIMLNKINLPITLILVSFYNVLRKDIENRDIPLEKNKQFKWNE